VRLGSSRLIKTAPPARRFACLRARLRSGAGWLTRFTCGCVAAVAFEKLPIEAVLAFYIFFAFRHRVVFLDHVFDHVHDAMGADTWSPSEVSDSVVDTGAASMALRLKSVACDRAEGGGSIACTHKYWVSGMAVVMDASAWSGLVTSDTVTRWRRQAKAGSSHGIWVSLESHDRQAVSQTQERANNATQGVTRHPDVGVRIAFSNIVVQVAGGEVVVTLFAKTLDKACRVAGVCVRHAIADLLPAVSSSLTAAT
jgi:hypothetical protein